MLSFEVLSFEVLSFEVLSFEVLSFEVLSFEVLSFEWLPLIGQIAELLKTQNSILDTSKLKTQTSNLKPQNSTPQNSKREREQPIFNKSIGNRYEKAILFHADFIFIQL